MSAGILKDFDLADGTNVVVQINKTYNGASRVALSFDGKTSQTTYWLTLEEAKAYKAILELALKEAES